MKYLALGALVVLAACNTPRAAKVESPEGSTPGDASAPPPGQEGVTDPSRPQQNGVGPDTPRDPGPPPMTAMASGLWSDKGTWPNGRLPREGDDVLVDDGQTLTLDVSTPALNGITVLGTLVFAEADIELKASWIMVHGTLQVGDKDNPFQHKATITLTGTDEEDPDAMGMGTRGIALMDRGKLELHGAIPSPTWTKLAETKEAGSKELVLTDSVSWRTGDELVIAPTDFYRLGRTEAHVVASVDGKKVGLQKGIERQKWGVLQYIDNSGVTLTPTTSVSSKALDERAEIGNLSRNIVIQSVDDQRWKNDGFGAHVMIMNPAEAHVEGVEFRRVGQAGLLARYPIHWHLWSYDTDGAERGDATGQYIRDSSIHDSAQRCVVLHGTNGVKVQRNVCYDIHGHGIFLEDAVERRNVIENNLVLNLHVPAEGKSLLVHETIGHRAGPSGFWLTNPDNEVRGNVAADSEGLGFWLAFPATPLGLNKGVAVEPAHVQLGVFADNVSHSNAVLGVQIDNVPIDDAGNVQDRHYRPTDTGKDDGTEVSATFSRTLSYKHEASEAGGAASFWNRSTSSTYEDFIIADYNGMGLSGASIDCNLTGAALIGTSLNNANGPEHADVAAIGAASYHSSCDIHDILFVNLPAAAGTPSGAFSSMDYYIMPVDKGLVRNPSNTLINSHPGYRVPSPNTLPDGSGRENFTLAGALWDPHGYWGPKENFWVLDLPFLTEGTTCSDVSQSVHHNDKSCKGPYYGVLSWTLNGDGDSDDARTRPLRVVRNDNGAEWFVDDGECTPFLGPMRHFAAVKGGSYTVSFPAGVQAGDAEDGTAGSKVSCEKLNNAAVAAPTDLRFAVTNIFTASDGFVIAVPYSGSVQPATPFVASFPNWGEVPTWDSWSAYRSGAADWQSGFRGDRWRPLNPGGSLSDVEDGDGSVYWQDASNNLIWVKVARMGMSVDMGDDRYGDPVLYQTMTYVFNQNAL